MNYRTNQQTMPLSLRLPIDTQTAWQSKLGATSDEKKYYSLGSLWCYLANSNIQQMSELIKKFAMAKVPQVGIAERQEILSFFTGQKQESSLIDFQRQTQTLLN